MFSEAGREDPRRRKIEPIGPGPGQIGFKRQRGLRQRLSEDRILPPILLGQCGNPAMSANTTTTMSPRATPKTKPRMRSMKPRPSARINPARLRAASAPTISTTSRISPNAIACFATGVMSSHPNMPATDPAYAIAAMKPTIHARERDHLADDAAGEREQRRQRNRRSRWRCRIRSWAATSHLQVTRRLHAPARHWAGAMIPL